MSIITGGQLHYAEQKDQQLVDPSFRLYFLVGFLFAAVTVRVSIPLAICEAAAMAFLWWYFRHTAQKRREGIRQYIDDVTDDMTTADKARCSRPRSR